MVPQSIAFDIDHVGTQILSAGCAMLMTPNKAETAVHGCWLLSSVVFLAATGFNPFYQCRLSSHACGFNIPFPHCVISSHIPQPYHLLSGSQSSSASCVKLIRSNKAKTAFHGCWFFSSTLLNFCTNRVLSILPLSP